MILGIKKLDPEAKVPTYAHPGDAGMDLISNEELVIKIGDRIACGTGIAMQIEEGYAGLIWDKSGIAAKSGVKTMAGVVDSGYRGEIKVVLVNLGENDYKINKGDEIAQMIIQKVEDSEIVEVSELDDSSRGGKGFGSTGVK